MRRIIQGALLVCLLAGCVLRREIVQLEAHETRNNFKVQTHTVKWFFLSVWHEWEIWSCQRYAGDQVVCREPELP